MLGIDTILFNVILVVPFGRYYQKQIEGMGLQSGCQKYGRSIFRIRVVRFILFQFTRLPHIRQYLFIYFIHFNSFSFYLLIYIVAYFTHDCDSLAFLYLICLEM